MLSITNYRDTSRNQSFTYDALNRITSGWSTAGTGALSWGENYAVDAWGNLMTSPMSGKAHGGNFQCAGDPQNHATCLSYDAAGNVTVNSPASYTYDQENRIASTAGMTYVYDANGNRVEKASGSTGTLYWYGAPGVIAESDLSGALKSEYVFFGGKRVARIDSPGNTVHYHLSDHLNSPSIVVSSTGIPEEESDYSSFGTEYPVISSGANHYKFTGKERDSETGLDYFSARYYGNALGRFMTPDPLPWIHWQHGNEDDQKRLESYIGNPQNFDMYAYVLNNPLNHTDPTGMNACGTKDDSKCNVTVTIADRTKDAKGNYNDQFKNVTNQKNYNATAVVSVNGKEVGTFLVKTTSSDSSKSATLATGTYNGTLTTHNGHLVIRLQPTNAVPTAFPNPSRKDGAWIAQGILIHRAGVDNFTGVGHDGRAVSAGCQVICTSQYSAFESATGMSASPAQQHFTINVWSSANQTPSQPGVPID